MSEKIRTELLALKAASSDGLLHADEAVDWARDNPQSALYSALEWNDTVAAREYRVQQVRQLIRLHVVNADGEPQLVSLTFDRRQNGGYRGVDEVVADKNLSEMMLKDALAELERVQARYKHVQELTAVWQQVAEVKRRRERRTEEARITA